jgi:hypothetical protein
MAGAVRTIYNNNNSPYVRGSLRVFDADRLDCDTVTLNVFTTLPNGAWPSLSDTAGCRALPRADQRPELGYGVAVRTDRPSAWWRFDDGSSAVAADSAGERDGTHRSRSGSSRPPVVLTDVRNEARNMGAGYVQIPSAPPLAPELIAGRSPFTVEAWVRTGPPSTTATFLGLDGGLRLAVEPNGTIGASTAPASNPASRTIRSAPGYANSEWHHVVYTRDQAGRRLALWINGTLVASTPIDAQLELPAGELRQLGGNFTGDLDEVAFYPTALSVGRIVAHFQAGGDATVTLTEATGGLLATRVTASLQLDGARSRQPITLAMSDDAVNDTTIRCATGSTTRPSRATTCQTGSDGSVVFVVARTRAGIADSVDARIGTGVTLATLELSPARESISYAALGDSYSSGESGTDVGYLSDDGCHRRAGAYSQLFHWNASRIVDRKLIACTGARTFHITDSIDDPEANGFPGPEYRTPDGSPTEPVQLETLARRNGTDELVTISIGGNDSGWAGLIQHCALDNAVWGALIGGARPSDCMIGRYDGALLTDHVDQQLEIVELRVVSTLAEIRAAAGDTASVVLVGYPQLFPRTRAEQSCAQFSPDIGSLIPNSVTPDGLLRIELLSVAEQNYFRAKVDEMDQRLERAAAQAGVYYLSVLDAFAGHEVCGNDGQYVAGIAYEPGDLGVSAGSYHPTDSGHQAYADTLEAFLAERVAAGDPVNAAGLPYVPRGGSPRTARPFTVVGADDATAAATLDVDRDPVFDVEITGEPLRAASDIGLAGPWVESGQTLRVTGKYLAPGTQPSVALTVVTGQTPATVIADVPIVASDDGTATVTIEVPAVDGVALAGLAVLGPDGAVLGDVAFLRITPNRSLVEINAVDDAVTVGVGGSGEFDVLVNDMIPADVSVSVTVDSAVDGVTVIDGGLVSVDATVSGDIGTYEFAYTACTTDGACSSARAVVTVDAGCTITGSDSDDVITGTAGDDVICAGAGDDTVDGDGGDDVIYGQEVRWNESTLDRQLDWSLISKGWVEPGPEAWTRAAQVLDHARQRLIKHPAEADSIAHGAGDVLAVAARRADGIRGAGPLSGAVRNVDRAARPAYGQRPAPSRTGTDLRLLAVALAAGASRDDGGAAAIGAVAALLVALVAIRASQGRNTQAAAAERAGAVAWNPRSPSMSQAPPEPLAASARTPTSDPGPAPQRLQRSARRRS